MRLLRADDLLLSLKLVKLSKFGMGGEADFDVRQGAPPPVQLLPYARLLVLQEHELPLLRSAHLPQQPLCAANEDNAFRHIAMRVEARLAAYPTTLDEDEYALNSGMWPRASRRSCALRGLALEKRILSALRGSLRLHIELVLRGRHLV